MGGLRLVVDAAGFCSRMASCAAVRGHGWNYRFLFHFVESIDVVILSAACGLRKARITFLVSPPPGLEEEFLFLDKI